MSYSSDTDLLKEMSSTELARLTGVTNGTNYDTERTAYARANADAIIDSYLNCRYNVPFNEPIDPIIRKISNDLTVVLLNEYYYGKSSLNMTILDRKSEAYTTLNALQESTMNLLTSSPGNTSPPLIIANKPATKIFPDDLIAQFTD